jgi:hypothetical protein
MMGHDLLGDALQFTSNRQRAAAKDTDQFSLPLLLPRHGALSMALVRMTSQLERPAYMARRKESHEMGSLVP